MMIRKKGATHAGGYVIHFLDGGPPEERLIVTGTKEECEAFYNIMPGISYSGERPVDRAEFVVVEWPEDCHPTQGKP